MPRYLLVFLALLCGYSTWDWYDHVSRPDSIFAEHPVAWGVFSLGSTAVIVMVILGGDALLRRRRGQAGFPVHAALLALAIAIHVFATGPLLDKLTWPHGQLTFKPIAAVVVIPIGIAALALCRALFPPRKPQENSTATQA